MSRKTGFETGFGAMGGEGLGLGEGYPALGERDTVALPPAAVLGVSGRDGVGAEGQGEVCRIGPRAPAENHGGSRCGGLAASGHFCSRGHLHGQLLEGGVLRTQQGRRTNTWLRVVVANDEGTGSSPLRRKQSGTGGRFGVPVAPPLPDALAGLGGEVAQTLPEACGSWRSTHTNVYTVGWGGAGE